MLVSCISNLVKKRENLFSFFFFYSPPHVGQFSKRYMYYFFSFTSLQRIWHSTQVAVGSPWSSTEVDPGYRSLPGWIWASLQCWAPAEDSVPQPGPGRPPWDPKGCCWTPAHPWMCSSMRKRQRRREEERERERDWLIWQGQFLLGFKSRWNNFTNKQWPYTWHYWTDKAKDNYVTNYKTVQIDNW